MLQGLFSDPNVLAAIAKLASSAPAGGSVPFAPQPTGMPVGLGPGAPLARYNSPQVPTLGVSEGVRDIEPGGAQTVDAPSVPGQAPFGPWSYMVPPADPNAVPGPVVPGATNVGGIPTSWARTFGLVPADPSLREQADAAYAEAGDVEVPRPGRPAFRTIDLIGLLPALLAGDQGGQYLSAFMRGKGAYSDQDNAYAQAEAERARQSLNARGASLSRAADNQDLIAGRNALQEGKNTTTLGVAGIKADSAETVARIRGRFALESTVERAQAARESARLASTDRRFNGLIKMAIGPVPSERSLAIKALRDSKEYEDLFGSATDAQIVAAAQATAKEQDLVASAAERVAKAADLRAHAGYLGALENRLDKLTPAEVEQKLASAKALRARASESLTKMGVDLATTSLIRAKANNYSNEFRLRYQEVQARIAKLSQTAAPTSKTVEQLTSLYKSQATLARNSANGILKANDGDIPAQNSPHYAAYQQALTDEQDAIQKTKELAKNVGMNPVTSTPQAPPSLPGGGTGVIQYVGGNANAQIRTPGGLFSPAQLVEEANQAVRNGIMTREQAVQKLKGLGVTGR